MSEFHCPFYSKRDIPRYQNDGIKDFDHIFNCGMCIHYIWESSFGDCSHRKDLTSFKEWDKDNG
jgi:hypothetical protein